MIKARFDRYLGLTILGYILLIAGSFMPVIILSGSEDLWISMTYNSFGGGMGDGFLILGLLALSIPLVLLAKYRWLAIPSLLIFGIVLIDFLDVQGNFLFSEYIFIPTWIVLFIGSVVIFAVSVMHFVQMRNSKTKDVAKMQEATA